MKFDMVLDIFHYCSYCYYSCHKEIVICWLPFLISSGLSDGLRPLYLRILKSLKSTCFID